MADSPVKPKSDAMTLNDALCAAVSALIKETGMHPRLVAVAAVCSEDGDPESDSIDNLVFMRFLGSPDTAYTSQSDSLAMSGVLTDLLHDSTVMRQVGRRAGTSVH